MFFYFPDVPGPVEELDTTDVTENSIGISWEEPEDDGGRNILKYVIEKRETTRSSKYLY